MWAFDYDIDAGVPHDRRLFVDMAAYVGRPDGATMDSDGCYWVAGNDGGSLLRFTPAGKLDRELQVPVPKPSMPCFGGPELDALLATSSGQAGREDDGLAGGVWRVRPGVRGVSEVAFGG